MDWWKIATVGLGAYVFGQLLVFKLSVDAIDYWEARGYLNGLMRASGSKEMATANLNQWRDFWLAQSGWASLIINSLYGYGQKRILELYG